MDYKNNSNTGLIIVADCMLLSVEYIGNVHLFFNTLLAWLGFASHVNVGLYFMTGGTAEAARLGATWRCRVMFLVRVTETATLGDVAPTNLAVAGKTR